MKKKEIESNMRNVRDISSKTVFDHPVLCAQFLRDNVNIPLLKDVKPEDIEDVSERYRPYLGTEFASDSVKRIWLHDTKNSQKDSLFLISLIEHKSTVDYNVTMQMLKYILCIWLEYGKEMERDYPGITATKDFRYPAVIPVVYYEGKGKWTADRQLKDRVAQNDMFGEWIPNFRYEVVRLHDFSNEMLLDRKNEMSLIMLFNKIQDTVDLSEFLKLPTEKLNQIIKDTPENILDIIVSVMESLGMKVGASEEEINECVHKIKERKMGYLFENIEKMDIQAERRNTEKARQETEDARRRTEEERHRAEEAERKVEEMIENMILLCQELGTSREAAVEKLVEQCGLEHTLAENKVNLYWKVEREEGNK